MSIPRELHWANGRLTARPIRELKQFREEKELFRCEKEVRLPMYQRGELYFQNKGEMLTIRIGEDAEIQWKDGLVRLSLSEQAGYGRTERFLRISNLRNIHLFLDSSSIEVFFNDGEYVMTSRYYPCENQSINILGEGEGEQYPLRPMTFAWKSSMQ